MVSLHSPRTVLSLRHTPSWLLLAFSAGSVNAIGFMACSRFVTHVTGAVSQLGMDTGAIAVDAAVAIGCFIAGAMSSAVLIDARYYRKKSPLYAVPLLAVAGILALLALLGKLGAFGAFGDSLSSSSDLAFIATLAFVMGLQNAAVATSTGLLVRSTHMTGPATDLGVDIVTAMYADGEARHKALRHAALRAGKILAFLGGAAAGAVLAARFAYSAFLVPAIIVAIATLTSFVRDPIVRTESGEPVAS